MSAFEHRAGERRTFITEELNSHGSSRHLSSFSSPHIRSWPLQDKQWDNIRWEEKPDWRTLEALLLAMSERQGQSRT